MDKIRLDIVQYEEWAADKIGAQWDLGCDWRLEGDPVGAARWRVSWFEKTGDLVAVDLDSMRDRCIALGQWRDKSVLDKAMYGWEYMDNLGLLAEKLNDVLGLPRSDSLLFHLQARWDILNECEREIIGRLLDEAEHREAGSLEKG